MNPKDDTGSRLKQLEFLIGNWQSEGEIFANSGDTSEKIKGTDTYEWILDGQFILHRADVMMGNERTEVLEVINYDDVATTFLLRSFDNKGTITIMRSSLDQNGTMIITGENMRSTLNRSPDGNQMNVLWERSEDRITWIPWMEMNFKK